jgi:hypothetical protein
MVMRLVSPQEFAAFSATLGHGGADITAIFAEWIRAEVHARGQTSRAAALARISRWYSEELSSPLQRLCEALELVGDLTLAPGGILYATPTRIVSLAKGARIFGSMPTRALQEVFGTAIECRGTARSVALVSGLDEYVSQLEGVVVTPEAWSGLDVAPVADDAYLQALDHRLQWSSKPAGSLERDQTLEWRTWVVSSEGDRWRPEAAGRLWWSRNCFGYHYRVWTAGESPAQAPFIMLSQDEADRARFAMSRENSDVSRMQVSREGKNVVLTIPGWLPRPEYRWLSLLATPTSGKQISTWILPASEEENVISCLRERLGLHSEST